MKHARWMTIMTSMALTSVFIGVVGCGKKGGNASVSAPPPTVPPVQPVVPTAAPMVSTRFGNYMRITDRAPFEALLRDQGICNQYNIVNIGSANCRYFSRSGYVILQSNASQLTVTIGAGANSPNSVYDYYGINSRRVSFPIAAQVYPINNGAGFEFRSQETVGAFPNSNQALGLRGFVEQGTWNDNELNVELFYQGRKFAEARVVHY